MKDRVAIITGASSGIGEATAIRFAKAGAKVGLIDIKEENAKKVKMAIENQNGQAFIAEADVKDPEQIQQAINSIVDHFGQLDFVFANAGINGKLAPIEDITPTEWDETLETNLKGTFLTVKYAIPHMKKNGGSIVITSSINGNREFAGFGMAAYSSSKAGQMAFGKMAALELSNYRIRVNIICPGWIKTNIQENTFPEKENLEKIEIPVEYPEGSQPLDGEPGTPEEVADLVYFLGSDQASHISGTEVYIDGASTLL
ncbi:SDR family oxidoreductase [Amphibacillus xylanus]|uniref:Oxidoreductase n=1 Tax=Amphibacillus xylanus (strain ATCC 51415 / DSM 6626 / JCM 7361 / LMG 17667 / NBRC 15112 / Ep01) TaxID=698758 RepID=K0IZA7_AMPXN|nr:SDR family NAD(P)-dependent oxidoreductase [Amphibacillus xylanus]BAM47885.1 oxidoreductase [Amphibacillus xylanus NBRC 15112]